MTDLDGIPGFAVPSRGPNRRAMVAVSPDLLAHMLHLPSSVRIAHVEFDHTRQSIRLAVEGDPLPELDPEHEALTASTFDTTVFQLDHDGQRWTRAEWDLPWADSS